MKILIIVESQTKAKTITKILNNIDGNTYIVMSSLGHICNLDNIKHNKLGIDIDNNYTPVYTQVKDRKPLIKKLIDQAKQCDRIIIASDEDREGEAIGWHLANTLKLNIETTDRIVFHEITKTAILDALKHPKRIDMNMVKAQQARQVLDKLVGYTLSPMLWRNVKSKLSAGRVQSVCLRLVTDKEADIKKHNAELLYKTCGSFQTENNPQEIDGKLNKDFKTADETTAFLNDCKKAVFKINKIKKENKNQKPPPPFTTSVLQQTAYSKFGLPPKKVMSIAQSLYEKGLITYHRTDSITLSKFITDEVEKYVKTTYNDKYHKFRTYKTNSKNAQEAHEAIRPTNINKLSISGTTNDSSIENRLHVLNYL
jgi:DNA topoisomerase-1